MFMDWKSVTQIHPIRNTLLWIYKSCADCLSRASMEHVPSTLNTDSLLHLHSYSLCGTQMLHCKRSTLQRNVQPCAATSSPRRCCLNCSRLLSRMWVSGDNLPGPNPVPASGVMATHPPFPTPPMSCLLPTDIPILGLAPATIWSSELRSLWKTQAPHQANLPPLHFWRIPSPAPLMCFSDCRS